MKLIKVFMFLMCLMCLGALSYAGVVIGNYYAAEAPPEVVDLIVDVDIITDNDGIIG
jgi:hypothetical protein